MSFCNREMKRGTVCQRAVFREDLCFAHFSRKMREELSGEGDFITRKLYLIRVLDEPAYTNNPLKGKLVLTSDKFWINCSLTDVL